jgi:hypothetical protein
VISAKRKKINLWGHTLECEEPAPGSKIAAINSGIEARLAAFNEHKEVLLALLNYAHKRGPQAKRFDRDKVWSDVKFLAWQLFLQEGAKREQLTMPPADRVKRLRKLEDALSRSRREVNKAIKEIKDDAEDELCRAWLDGMDKRLDAPPLRQEFKKVGTNLAALETAAFRAIEDMPKRDGGRPGGTGVLPYGVIIILAYLYLDNTERRPGAGRGPFARFVFNFMTALGHPDLVYQTLIDDIKDARKRDLMRPEANRMRPSPFTKHGG